MINLFSVHDSPGIVAAIFTVAGGVLARVITALSAYLRHKSAERRARIRRDVELAKQGGEAERAQQVEALETAAGLRSELRQHITNLNEVIEGLNLQIENWRSKYYELRIQMATLEEQHKSLDADCKQLLLDKERLALRVEYYAEEAKRRGE